jgi:hypothetical protein
MLGNLKKVIIIPLKADKIDKTFFNYLFSIEIFRFNHLLWVHKNSELRKMRQFVSVIRYL